MSLARTLGLATIAAIIMVGLGWVLWLRPLVIAGKQLRNWADVRIYFVMVEDYKKAHGAFPETLSKAVPASFAHRDFWLAARDVYGRALHYEVHGDEFLIASYGRDGIHDERPYARDGDDAQRKALPCREANADTVYSSDGVFQACTK